MTERVRPFRRRLVVWYAGMLILLLAVFGVMLSRSLERMLLDQLTDSLVGQAEAVSLALPEDSSALQSSVVDLGGGLGIRITVIAPDGTVLAELFDEPRKRLEQSPPLISIKVRLPHSLLKAFHRQTTKRDSTHASSPRGRVTAITGDLGKL